MRISLLVPIALASLAVAGCASAPAPALTTRQTIEDSLVLLTVDKVSSGFSYQDLLVFVDNVPYHMGGKMDHGQQLYEVQGKKVGTDTAVIGDVIRVPVAGQHSVELRHATGTSLQQLNLNIPDHSAPAATTLAAPSKSGSNVDRTTAFLWSAVDDPSGNSYEIEYWISEAGLNAPHSAVTGLIAPTYAIPASNQLLPSTPYSWHVRAIDGAGNVGPWSETWVFTTTA